MLLIIDYCVQYSVACHCIPYNTGASADNCIPYNVAYHCIPYVTGAAIHNCIPYDILFPFQCCIKYGLDLCGLTFSLGRPYIIVKVVFLII